MGFRVAQKGKMAAILCTKLHENHYISKCVCVHSSMVELTSLENKPFHPLGNLINPNIALACLSFDISLAICEPS